MDRGQAGSSTGSHIGGVFQIAETRRSLDQSFRPGKWQRLDATDPGTGHKNINCWNRKEKDFAPGWQETAIEASGACPTNSFKFDPMSLSQRPLQRIAPAVKLGGRHRMT